MEATPKFWTSLALTHWPFGYWRGVRSRLGESFWQEPLCRVGVPKLRVSPCTVQVGFRQGQRGSHWPNQKSEGF